MANYYIIGLDQYQLFLKCLQNHNSWKCALNSNVFLQHHFDTKGMRDQNAFYDNKT